jgi:hypothetical protein
LPEGNKENHEQNSSQVSQFPDRDLESGDPEYKGVLLLNRDIQLIINSSPIVHHRSLVPYIVLDIRKVHAIYGLCNDAFRILDDIVWNGRMIIEE